MFHPDACPFGSVELHPDFYISLSFGHSVPLDGLPLQGASALLYPDPA